MREELSNLRENATHTNTSVREETMELKDELMRKEKEIIELKYHLRDSDMAKDQFSQNSIEIMNNYHLLRNENDTLRLQLEQQRQSYEEKIERRDEHRRKRKDEWKKTINTLKDENEYLKYNSESQSSVNADTILQSLYPQMFSGQSHHDLRSEF